MKWLRVEYKRYEGAHKVLLCASRGAERGIEGKSRIPLRVSVQVSEHVGTHRNTSKGNKQTNKIHKSKRPPSKRGPGGMQEAATGQTRWLGSFLIKCLLEWAF